MDDHNRFKEENREWEDLCINADLRSCTQISLIRVSAFICSYFVLKKMIITRQ
jgi:hypothetical protein